MKIINILVILGLSQAVVMKSNTQISNQQKLQMKAQIDEAIDIALSNYFSVYKSIRLATVVQNQVQSTRQN